MERGICTVCAGRSKLIHSVPATAANGHDSQVLEELLHGGETRVWGDSAYTGQKERLSVVVICSESTAWIRAGLPGQMGTR